MAPLEVELSMVVIVYRMRDQALRTLHSLSPQYQQGIDASQYEIVVVENASDQILGEEAAVSAAPNVTYYLNTEDSPSPIPSIHFGVQKTNGKLLGLVIDGARLLTPNVLRFALAARKLDENAVISVPGYHLGRQLQQNAVQSGYDEAEESALLAGINWPSDGYKLFDVACFSGSCNAGYFRPFAETNCLFLGRDFFESLGGFDPLFVSPGGGMANLDFYKRVCERDETSLFVLLGEGTFHQFHKGVTTGGIQDRDQFMKRIHEEYVSIRGEPYELPERPATFLGTVPPNALKFVRDSANSAETTGR